MKYIFALLIVLFSSTLSAEIPKNKKQETAIFAGGCFWCMEKPFDKLNGVISTTSGYIGGHVKNPTYEQVSAGNTGHIESLRVVFDPLKIDYKTLLDTFWVNIDPLDGSGQFCDKGFQYTSAIFSQNNEQKMLAEDSFRKIQKRFKAIIQTKIIEGTEFYPAENYHQDFYIKNPIRYNFYRGKCGRDNRLKELWDDAR